MTDLAFSCACGTVTGVVKDVGPGEGDHVYCHCTDCQSVPKFLGAEDRILDEAGGTELYQTRCARLTFHSGKDQLAGLHMTDKPTLRWFAKCCDTPMFNTYANGSFPIPPCLSRIARRAADRRWGRCADTSSWKTLPAKPMA